MAQYTFDTMRSGLESYSKHCDNTNMNWSYGTMHSSGYSILLQKAHDEDEPMVVAGCRYFTLRQAKDHWSKASHHRLPADRLEALHAIAGLVRRAQLAGRLSKKIKFKAEIKVKKPKVAASRKRTVKKATKTKKRARR